MGLVAILEVQVLFPYLIQWWNTMALKSLAQIMSFISLSSLWLSVTALPDRGTFLIAKRSIPENIYKNLVLYEQYAAASYCNSNSGSPHTKLTCAGNNANNCPLVEIAKTMTLAEFQDSSATDSTGYVAFDHTRKVIVVAFRGSRSVRNFVTDLEYNTNSTDLCAGCEAHGGFWQGWQETRRGTLDAVKLAKEEKPEYEIVVTGHSLGGALATLCAAELRRSGYSAALYTYGSPRVGNPALAIFVSNQPGGNFRVTHTNDPVPHLPLIAMGFQHVSPEYYISTGGKSTVGINGIRKYAGAQDWGGNTGHLMTNIDSHLWYFNPVTACGQGIEF